MEKNKNKFIYFIIVLIFLIISIGVYISIFFKSVDRNSYLELVSGKGLLNEKVLEIGKREKLSKDDVIETKTKDSLAVIEWGDGSITRLGGNTKVEIENEYVSKNGNDINIFFRLFSGKTWSNVISYMGEDSYFKQSFGDTEAAVRGTVFSVDLDRDYLQVESHKVDLTSEKYGKVEVTENKQLKLSDFSFISLEDFIKFFKDKVFFEINQKMDKEYLMKLALDLQKNLDRLIAATSRKVDDLTGVEREKLYAELMSQYQQINFATSSVSEELFNLKISLKEKLIKLTPDSQKSSLLDTLSYDLKDIFNTKNFGSFEGITNILKENEKFIDSEKMQEYFNIFNIKSEIGATIDKTIDIFKSEVINNPNYKEFFNSVSNSINNSINDQKNMFRRFVDWIRDLF
ncbi:FecR domain-containing protein [Candidatus Gracilibacteria bacterium]|nr:FecR domain-containing protein [Candidatus Gracilibacteria bacterium]